MFFRKISENREIEDITADELNILICRFEDGGVYEPTTRFLPLFSGDTQDLGHSFFYTDFSAGE